LTGSALGVVMIPVLNKYLSVAATEKPSIMLFMAFANASLGILALTPLLLHSLTRRFVLDVYYNDKTQTFTTVHYNFVLQKRALRFQASDVLLPEHSEPARKMWIPLATCFVDKHPLMLLLDPEQYSDKLAFQKLTANLALDAEKSE
jgi:transmembrane protein 70